MDVNEVADFLAADGKRKASAARRRAKKQPEPSARPTETVEQRRARFTTKTFLDLPEAVEHSGLGSGVLLALASAGILRHQVHRVRGRDRHVFFRADVDAYLDEMRGQARE